MQCIAPVRIIETDRAVRVCRPTPVMRSIRKPKQERRVRFKFIKALFTLAAVAAIAVFVFAKAKDVIAPYGTENINTSKSNTMPLQMQNPELPNGCEATSLAMALTAAGVPTDKMKANASIPSKEFETSNSGVRMGADPNTAYAGNATTQNGFYCFAPPVVEGANLLLKESNSSKAAVDITGASIEELEGYLKSGVPVIAWVTINFSELKYCENTVWYIKESSEQYRPYSNLHCVLVCEKKGDKYIINDPLNGSRKVSAAQFEESYIQMGKKAVIIS